ncbi:MAG TPA: FRG domain-containing protein [Gemmatirosa sp.]|nr:FRG domain-containing protein [Gemmatirosa sp.]
MPFPTVEIRSLGQLIDCITPSDPDPVSGRRREAAVFRGAGDASWPLYTSLDRLGGIERAHGKRGLEPHILRNFIRYSRPHLGHARTEWELLIAAQHHGLATRLLDWSWSPLVAAHFATLGRRERGPDHPDAGRERSERSGSHGTGPDRVVWRLDWQQVHRHFGFPELALLADDLDRLRGADSDGHFTPWELMERAEQVEPFACLLDPPTLDARIAAQSAVFTLCSDATRPFDAFLAEHGLEEALTRYVIPAEATALFRDQLDLVTMDERRLFPDLDGVATQMRRYYS